MNYIISEEQLLQVLNYLDLKPHGEVRALVNILTALPQANIVENPEKIEA